MTFARFVQAVDNIVQVQLGSDSPRPIHVSPRQVQWERSGRELRLVLQPPGMAISERIEPGDDYPASAPFSLTDDNTQVVADEVIQLWHAHVEDTILRQRPPLE